MSTWMFERSDALRGLHYLDNAATTQLLCSAHDVMAEFEMAGRANVRRGIHRLADEADARYEDSRASVARYLGVRSDEIVFTSGTTAALNLLAISLAQDWRAGDNVVVTALEHHSNFVPWQMAARRAGVEFRCVPVCADGTIDIAQLHRSVSNRTRVLAVTHASNVTGLVTDLAPFAELTRRVGARLVVDSAQTIVHGLFPAEADFAAFSGHKAYGPTGIGVLYGRRELLAELPPAFGGGGMVGRVGLHGTTWAEPPTRFEAGTPAIVQAVGLGRAVEWLEMTGRPALRAQVAALTETALTTLQRIDGVRIVGSIGPEKQRAGLFSFTVDGVHPHDVCHSLNDAGVLVRAGHLCAQPLMQSLGLDGVVRASFAAFNAMDDVEALSVAVRRVSRIRS